MLGSATSLDRVQLQLCDAFLSTPSESLMSSESSHSVPKEKEADFLILSNDVVRLLGAENQRLKARIIALEERATSAERKAERLSVKRREAKELIRELETKVCVTFQREGLSILTSSSGTTRNRVEKTERGRESAILAR